MKVVMLLVARDDADVIDAQIAFHLNAGVDLIIATDHESTDGTSDILESYAREGHVLRLSQRGEPREDEWRANMGRRAVEERSADWVIDAHVDEFWLPRAESIKDVLAAIPSRYGVVQALTRVFLPRVDAAGPWPDRLTVRRRLVDLNTDESAGRLDWALRPICRVVGGLVPIGPRDVVLDGMVPLRAWYPIEVLRFPLRSSEQARRRLAGRSSPTLPSSRVERRLFDGAGQDGGRCGWDDVAVTDDDVHHGIDSRTLVLDERLRSSLGRIQQSRTAQRAYALPCGEPNRLDLAVPTVVEDMAYAEECAAVREVDLDSVREDVQRLEDRISPLEQRFWPRVTQTLSRVVRR